MAPGPNTERSFGMGYSWVKLPHAYWKKSTHGSAVVRMNRLSRPGKGSYVFSAPAVPALGVCAHTPAHNADTTTSVIFKPVRLITFFLYDFVCIVADSPQSM